MISIIAAMTTERVIGKDNKLPWLNIKEDMDHFKTVTSGHSVIMGRKTYESIPPKFRPLPKRDNIIISSTMPEKEGIDVVRSIDQAIERARSYKNEIFIIGGASIYQQALPITERMYLSVLKKEYEGDTYFPQFNEDNWIVTSRKECTDFELLIYDRK
ncbi:MAG: dihydrofolate reductase [Nanoarchaeota archaeon]|nr:dihydrofolate reductase [Nanoarchaeota archaeon]